MPLATVSVLLFEEKLLFVRTMLGVIVQDICKSDGKAELLRAKNDASSTWVSAVESTG